MIILLSSPKFLWEEKGSPSEKEVKKVVRTEKKLKRRREERLSRVVNIKERREDTIQSRTLTLDSKEAASST